MKKVLSIMIFMIFLLSGCGKNEESITIVGSTSMEKLSNAMAESYMIENEISINTEFVGSSAGIEALISGSADIANSSRTLKGEEKAKGIVENIVAIDGMAVVIDNENPVEDLSKEELTKIYIGKVKNWSEVGGKDSAIVVIGREAGSGTRKAFEEVLDVEGKCKYSNELDSTGAVMAKVLNTPGAIGYVSLDVINDSVKSVKLDGIEATAENIKGDKYFLARPFVMATKGEIKEQSEEIRDWFSYIYSEKGKVVIEKVGLIPV